MSLILQLRHIPTTSVGMAPECLPIYQPEAQAEGIFFTTRSASIERPTQVGDQIIDVLNADRQPHQTVIDADRGTFLGRD